jgi:hypothetical protein
MWADLFCNLAQPKIFFYDIVMHNVFFAIFLHDWYKILRLLFICNYLFSNKLNIWVCFVLLWTLIVIYTLPLANVTFVSIIYSAFFLSGWKRNSYIIFHLWQVFFPELWKAFYTKFLNRDFFSSILKFINSLYTCYKNVHSYKKSCPFYVLFTSFYGSQFSYIFDTRKIFPRDILFIDMPVLIWGNMSFCSVVRMRWNHIFNNIKLSISLYNKRSFNIFFWSGMNMFLVP